MHLARVILFCGSSALALAASTEKSTRDQPSSDAFIERLLPAAKDSGFRRADMWIWDGSVIRGEDGLWHMFASMWTKEVPFHPNWVTNSRVVRSVATHPEGPYKYVEDVLPPREGGYWDGKMTHNPTIHRAGKTYLLYYTGTTYDEPIPRGPASVELRGTARANQRLGLATAPSPSGPWTRMDKPIIEPRPDEWDSLLTTNAAPWVEADGSVLLLYKSATGGRGPLKYGVARAKHFRGPYERVSDGPIVWQDDPNLSYEDAYIWKEAREFRMIFKDMGSRLTGEHHAGAYATSPDGVTWKLARTPKAYSRLVRWNDGTETLQGSLERPQLILRDGHPTHLVFATADGPGGWQRATNTWSIVIPLRPPSGR